MDWFGFWMFLSVFLLCDTWLFSKGYDSLFWEAVTDDEQRIQEQAKKEESK